MAWAWQVSVRNGRPPPSGCRRSQNYSSGSIVAQPSTPLLHFSDTSISSSDYHFGLDPAEAFTPQLHVTRVPAALVETWRSVLTTQERSPEAPWPQEGDRFWGRSIVEGGAAF